MSIEASYPLSPMQQGMLFHSLDASYSKVYISQITCALYESLNSSAFERAWQRVVQRHPVLRTSFRWDGVSEPFQEVHSHAPVPFEQQDWRGMSAGQRQNRLETYSQADRQRGFDLTDVPLMRLALLRVAEADYQFLWTFHHLLLDGRSFPLILNEVFAFYGAFCQGRDLNLKQPRPYRDYIDWLAKRDVTDAETFWRHTLARFTAPTPLVVDRTQLVESSMYQDYGHQGIRLSETITSALQSLAQQHQLRLATLLQGAWAVLLSRYSGVDDIVFGATRRCRRTALEGAESMVGVLINTLPVRARVSRDSKLLPWLKELRAQWIAVRDHEHTPLTKVQAWSDIPPGQPLFESILVFENASLNSTLRAQGGSWENREFRYLGQTNYPLTLLGFAEPGLLLEIVHDRRRIDDATADRMLGHLATVLEGMAAHSAQRLSSLPLLTKVERHQVLVEWNDTQKDYAIEKSVHEGIFEPQVERTPEAVAVAFEDDELTYRELNCRANQLAHYLRKLGVGPEVLVGICVERSLDMVIAVLGILKAGGAYVPLDPEYPKKRLAFMLADTQLSVLVTQGQLAEKLPGHEASVVCLDRDWGLICQESEENPVSGVTTESLACVIYTSGSSGQPKGVLIVHRGLSNVVESDLRTFDLRPGSRVLHFLSLSFDAATHHMLMALCSGATLYVVAKHALLLSSGLVRVLRDKAITHAAFTPSALAALVPEELPALRTIIVGGEVCSASLVEQWAPGRRFFNVYGPTEATIYSTVAECANGAQKPPIGCPIANTQTYVLDSHLRPVPIGVPGELHIGGAGVARGYLNRAKLTAEKFIPNPFNDEPGARLYKTGDLCRWLPDGNIEFLGRLDHQIKLRGFRIELGEIETVLEQHPAVGRAVVIVRSDGDGGRLVAYLTREGTARPSTQNLHRYLSHQLPEYMLPSAIVILDSMPLTANGKVDVEALPAPNLQRSTPESAPAPNALQQRLIAIWEQVLGVKGIGITDNFFDLGGHSLLALRIFAQLEKELGRTLPLASLFTAPTIEQLAAAYKDHSRAGGDDSPVVLQRNGSRPPLFCLAGAGGHVFSYRRLAQRLGSNQPCYGLQLPGIEGRLEPYERIEDMAAFFVQQIRRVQPEGPYYLIGYSHGGLIAYEIACQLTAQDQAVGLLVLVDAAVPGSRKLRPLVDRMRLHARIFWQLNRADKARYLKRRAIRLQQRLHRKPAPTDARPTTGSALLDAIDRVHAAGVGAGRRYVPPPYPGRVTLFRSAEPPDLQFLTGDPLYGWRSRASGVDVHTVPGKHVELLEEPNVRVLAEKVGACLQEARSRHSTVHRS